ncbi:uncharacterized protein F4807DRAFT_459082 [Annulohypoxylon truncatum]|uniref:uncharacterized protein n=1 Tax=Annulohypoxylon truncatum TaxID=327061 RepID=UPI00200857F9|nr:uncharacterized protein F4807DRAFT_459082 [Annulohypoxylon truncatum]KAI1210855.1 hypothetical protein F4807DRAFT_459082 [Annulohypoxylon truncatum]
MADEQVSLTSLILIIVLGGLIIRYLFFSPASQPPRPTRDAQSASRAREAAVERIQQMFPQVDRRTILWDLHRNGGNIAATTERILSGRLETPPVTFQPPPPPVSPTPSSTAQTQTFKAPPKPAEPDLITRYRLQDKVTANGEAESVTKSKPWSSNRDERQASLQRRRDEMILAARKKMEAKIAAEKATGKTQ